VREGVARRVELHQELPRHGGVEPRELGRERLDAVALPVGSWGVHASCGRVGIDWFVRRTSGGRHRGPVRRRRGTELQGGGDGTRGGDPDRGHHIATRRILHRLQLGDELLRLLLGETEEPRKHLALVLGRQHVRELVHGGQAEAPITKRLDDGWEPLDQLDRLRAVGRGALHETELAEEGEQAAMAEVEPELPAVELGELDEELRHRNVLAAEEIGKADGIFVCVHAMSFARDFSSF
jgi:hypothetical protein